MIVEKNLKVKKNFYNKTMFSSYQIFGKNLLAPFNY